MVSAFCILGLGSNDHKVMQGYLSLWVSRDTRRFFFKICC